MDQADARLRRAARVERGTGRRLPEEGRAEGADAKKLLRPPAAQGTRRSALSVAESRAAAQASMAAPNCTTAAR
jgi:hypothetical protein